MTASDVLRSVMNKLPPETRMTGFVDTVREVMQRIRAHGVQRGGWSFDWTRGTIDLVASYDTGTIAVTNGGTTVTGTGTTFTSGMAGRKIRIAGVPNLIDTFTDTTHVELAVAYGGETETAAEFVIYQDEYATTADLTAIHRIWDLTNSNKLQGLTPLALGDRDHLTNSSGTVQAYAEAGRNSSDVVLVQFHPYPTAIARLEYWYQADITQISGIGSSIDIPAYFDELVKHGCYARQLQILGSPLRLEEAAIFQEMIQEAWLIDNPIRDEKIRLARDDRIDSTRFLVRRQKKIVVT